MAKQKFYLNCKVVTHGGTVFSNPLKLGEVVLITQMLKENKSVTISREPISEQAYKQLFG